MKLQVIVNEQLLEAIDAHCEKFGFDRSEFIRSCIREKLFEQIDLGKTGEMIENMAGQEASIGKVGMTATEATMRHEWARESLKNKEKELGVKETKIVPVE